MLIRLLKEPLLHFAMLAVVIFAVHGLLNRGGTLAPDRIVVTAPKIEQMTAIFAKSQQRPPTAEELKGMIDDYVKEEVYYREALILGLDKDDSVIRRRLRQKMEFLSDAAVDALTPSESDLQSYLQSHQADFEDEPMLAFQQIFFNSERRGENVEQDAKSALAILRAKPDANISAMGDASMLPAELPLTGKTVISQTFGPEFADALDKTTTGQWTGPIKSGFGLHLIRSLERKPGRTPALAEVREAVARDWANAKRIELEDRRLEELLKRYQVTIEVPAAQESNP